MRELYRQDLAHLGDELVRMSRGVERAIQRATDALRDGDVTLAEQTIDADERLDAAALAIDDACVSLLALQGPVASDLRLIVGAMRLSRTMERQGDLARHLALIARSTHPAHQVCEAGAPLIEAMSRTAVEMAQLETRLVETQDLSIPGRIHEADDVLDELQMKVRRLVADDSVPLTRQEIVDLTLAARFLERFGDHAVSVARRTEWIVRGSTQGA